MSAIATSHVEQRLPRCHGRRKVRRPRPWSMARAHKMLRDAIVKLHNTLCLRTGRQQFIRKRRAPVHLDSVHSRQRRVALRLAHGPRAPTLCASWAHPPERDGHAASPLNRAPIDLISLACRNAMLPTIAAMRTGKTRANSGGAKNRRTAIRHI